MRWIWKKRESSDINYEDRSKCKDIQDHFILYFMLEKMEYGSVIGVSIRVSMSGSCRVEVGVFD